MTPRTSFFRIDNSAFQAFETRMQIHNLAAHGIETSTTLGRAALPNQAVAAMNLTHKNSCSPDFWPFGYTPGYRQQIVSCLTEIRCALLMSRRRAAQNLVEVAPLSAFSSNLGN